MRKSFVCSLVFLMITSLAVGQTALIAQASSPDSASQNQPALGTRSAEPPARGNEVASGTEIHATLDTRLSSAASKVGDRFTATVAEPVRAANGSIAIPAGSKVTGEVTEVQQGKYLPSVRGKAKLNMRFTQVQLANGNTVPLTATLVSVHSTKGGAKTSGNEGEVQGGTTGGKVAKNVGIGAAAGTVAGLIFGSALKGLAIGAIAGGGYVLATGGKDVVLPEQTGMVLRVDHNISVSGSGGQ